MGPYLERFSKFSHSIFLRLDWISRSVSPSERISRFITSKRWINETKGSISPAAFIPSAKTKATSVYRTSGCKESRVWSLGTLFVERMRRDKAKILGRADVRSDIVFKEELKIRPLLFPHPRHADLTNWPEEKDAQKDKALALAQASALRIVPRAQS